MTQPDIELIQAHILELTDQCTNVDALPFDRAQMVHDLRAWNRHDDAQRVADMDDFRLHGRDGSVWLLTGANFSDRQTLMKYPESDV